MMTTLYFLKDNRDYSSNSYLLWEEAKRLVQQQKIGFSQVIVVDTADPLPIDIEAGSHVWARFGDELEEMQRGLPILKWFEQNGAIPVNNFEATKRSASKIASSRFAFQQGISHPHTVFKMEDVNFFPCVVKLDIAKGSSGVWLASSANELEVLVKRISKQSGQPLLYQEFVPSKPVMDLRVFVARNVFTGKWNVLFYYRRLAAKGEFKANIFNGGTLDENISLTSGQIAYAISIAQQFDLGFSGADFFFGVHEKLIFNETNSRGVIDDIHPKNVLFPMFGV